jgi:hypothetical protein
MPGNAWKPDDVHRDMEMGQVSEVKENGKNEAKSSERSGLGGW